MSSASGSYSRIALPSIQLPLPSEIITALDTIPCSTAILSTYSPVLLFVMTAVILMPLPKRSFATFVINVSMAPDSVRSSFLMSSATCSYISPAFPTIIFSPSDLSISSTFIAKFIRLSPAFSQFCFVTLSLVITNASTKVPVSLFDISHRTVMFGFRLSFNSCSNASRPSCVVKLLSSKIFPHNSSASRISSAIFSGRISFVPTL